MEEWRNRFVPLLEIASGMLVLAGFSGALWWFTAEAAQLRDVRTKLQEHQSSFEQQVQSNFGAEQERLRFVLGELKQSQEQMEQSVAEGLQKTTDLETEVRQEVARGGNVQMEMNVTLGKLQKSLNSVESLRKKYESFEAVEQTRNGVQEKVILRGAGQAFLDENFSGFQIGDFPTEWGTGLAVACDEKQKTEKFLVGMSRSPGVLKREIAFPQNFRLRFAMYRILDHERFQIDLEDARGKKISVACFSGITRVMYLTGAAKSEMRHVSLTFSWDTVQLEIRDATVRVVVNESFIASSTLEGYANFVRMQITCEEWPKLRVDNFYGVDLGEEVKPVKKG